MTDTPDDRDPERDPETGATAGDDLEKLIAGLAAPLASVGQTIAAGLVGVVRAMLNAAYARGRADGFRQAHLAAFGAKPAAKSTSASTATKVGTVPSGLAAVHTDRAEPMVTAQELRKIRRRYGAGGPDGGDTGVCA